MESIPSEVIYLSITGSYAPLWTSREGIREFVQNWYDAMREDLPRDQLRSFSIDKRRSNLHDVDEYHGSSLRNGVERNLGTLSYDRRSKRMSMINRTGK